MCNWGATGTFGSGLDVGIGTCSPSRDLDVNGTTRLRGAIYNSVNSSGTSGQVLTSQGASAWTWTTPGTVTSVNTADGITGGPIIGSGTVRLTGQALALHNLGANGLIVKTPSGITARTITGGDGIVMTNGNGGAGNPTIFNVIASHGQLYNTGNLLGQTFDGTAREVDFTQQFSNSMTTSTANYTITIPATGTYEITYSGSYAVNATGLHLLYLNLYENASDLFQFQDGAIKSTFTQWK
jgi:hypothetical protein